MAYIYEELSTHDVAHRLMQDKNASWHDNYDACLALAEYLEEYAEGTDTNIELDIVAIRCEYSLMDSIADYNSQYGTEYEEMSDIEETTYINVDDESFIIQDF